MVKRSAAEQALRRLQQVIRTTGAPEPDDMGSTRRVPEQDRRRPDGQRFETMVFSRAEVAEVRRAAGTIAEDPGLEHLAKPEDAVWELAMAVALDKRNDKVALFLERHRRDVVQEDCYFGVDQLKSLAPWTVGEVTFLPADEAVVPLHPWSTSTEVGTVAKVPCAGTSPSRMMERGRAEVERALRVWRLALLTHGPLLMLHPDQLRFRVGDTYAFSDQRVGWQRHPGTPQVLTFDPRREAGGLETSPLLHQPQPPNSAWASSMERAMVWSERALLAVDPLEQILFGFFALEAVLGDKASGLKADVLSVRRMVLDHSLTESFGHPNRLWFLYDRVRSTAVHGGHPPRVSDREARNFVIDVVRALSQALELAGDATRTKEELHRQLDNDDAVPELIDWMRRNAGPEWEPILQQLEQRRAGIR